MHKSRRIVVRNENRSGRGEGSEKWRVKSEEWRVKSEQRSLSSERWTEVSEQRSLIIDHWTLIIDQWYWHEVFCVCRRGKVRELAQRSMWCNSPILQFTHVFNCPHLEGLIAISPYTCVIRTFASIDVNTCKYTCKYTKSITGMVWVCLRAL